MNIFEISISEFMLKIYLAERYYVIANCFYIDSDYNL